MSEPSQEAKQARLRINNEIRTLTLNEYQQVDEIIQQAIDTATAKELRDKIEALQRVRLVLWQDAAYPYDGKVIRDLDAALTGTGISPKPRTELDSRGDRQRGGK